MAITRKPLASAKSSAAQSNEEQLPYPVTPTSPKQDAGGFGADYATPTQGASHSDARPDTEPTPQSQTNSVPSISDIREGWVDGGINQHSTSTQPNTAASEHSLLPSALRVGAPGLTPRSSSESQNAEYTGLQKQNSQIPPSLRVQSSSENQNKAFGGSAQQLNHMPDTMGVHTPLPEQAERPGPASLPVRSTNPFHRANSSESRPDSSRANEGQGDGSDIWGEVTSVPPSAPPPPPPAEAPLNTQSLRQFDDLTLAEKSASKAPMTPESKPEVPFGSDGHSHTLMDFGEAEGYTSEAQTNPWAHQASVTNQKEGIFSDLSELDAASPQVTTQGIEPWGPAPALPPRVEDGLGKTTQRPKAMNERQGKAIEPPQALTERQDIAQAEPSLRVQLPNERVMPHSDTDTPQTKVNKRRTETYEIKHIRWQDSSSMEIRTTPIMIQNANGPCPLLALVNALTLSTPPSTNTALIETLRVREQISLGLLLDAVFDELMSRRRGEAAQELPDVGDLYTFLVTLHTGMNVNPRFTPVTTQPVNLLDDFEPSFAPSQEARKAGGFEETKEMELYSTFAIPLIHGWLPPRTHPAFAALQRSANTYEDAQNLMFREEELEDKLQRQGLSTEEQQLLEDIASVKYFLSSSATQLTGFGLDTITDTLSPGSINILFRNDHFSTLYKHPQSGQLLTLVTDMGYAGHDEVVWESLVDVSGEGCEFFSGDFRPIGHQGNTSSAQASSFSQQDDSGPTTAPSSNLNKPLPSPYQQRANSQTEEYSILSPKNTEQEDHDLALAMQLQEEEEDRSRRISIARRREDELSQAYLSSQAPHSAAANPVPRDSSRRQSQTRTGSSMTTPIRDPRTPRGTQPIRTPAVTPRLPIRPAARVIPQVHRDPEAGEDLPPPSYEDASKSEPYNPDAQPVYGTTGVPVQSFPAQRGGRRRGESAYSQNTSTTWQRPQTRTSGSLAGMSEEERMQRERDRDCVIM